MNSYEILELAFGQLWQVTILCVVAGWISRTLLFNRPVLSYQLWLVVLLKCVTPPLWASHCGVFSWCFQNVSNLSTAFAERVSGSTIGLDQLIVCLLAVWIAGFAFSLLRVYGTWIVLQKRIRSAALVPSEEIQQRVSQLIERLGIRQNVELVMTAEPIGPAVIGMWQPILVLPAELSQSKSVEELEPILAHELLHVRRGDTAVAILETVVRALWWFHPAVHRAADATSQAGELCCDGDVLGELMYKPRRYADSLLDVVEAKCRLQPVVAMPGIRDEQVTKERLRRIMVFKHSKPRALLRAGLLILALLVFLPGRPVKNDTSSETEETPVAVVENTFLR